MILPRAFYDKNPVHLAPHILGKYLVRQLPDGTILSGIITEVEAYIGAEDPASHSYKGLNERNKSLFKRGGHAYVHTQRHHTLLDIVVQNAEIPHSLLIRSIQPYEGIAEMQCTRRREEISSLTNGPGKICQALSITKAMDGIDMTVRKSGLWLEDRGITVRSKDIEKTPRIGLGRGKEALLRFVLTKPVD